MPRRSTNIKWLSVPPVNSLKPCATSAAASAFAFLRTCFWYSVNSGFNASPRQTAFAAMTCSNGPPWVPGKMALLKLNLSAASLLARIMPPLGPRRVLWVVVVTTSAYGIGLMCSPAATRPAMWAISTIKYAPTLSAISRNFLKSISLAYALAPARISFGLCSTARRSTWS